MPEKTKEETTIKEEWIVRLYEVYHEMPPHAGVVIVKPKLEGMIDFIEVTQTMSMRSYIAKLIAGLSDEKPDTTAKHMLMLEESMWEISYDAVENPTEEKLNDIELERRIELKVAEKFKPYERGFNKAKNAEVFILDHQTVLDYNDWYFLLKFTDYKSFDLGAYKLENKSAVKMAGESKISRQTCGALKTKYADGYSCDILNSYATIPMDFIAALLVIAEEKFNTFSELNNFCRLTLFFYTQIKRFGGFFSISMAGIGETLGFSKNTLYKFVDEMLNSNLIVRRFIGNGLQGIASGYTLGKSNH